MGFPRMGFPRVRFEFLRALDVSGVEDQMGEIMRTSNRHRSGSLMGRGLPAPLAAALLAGFLLVAAAPARADHDFRSAFESELGRIAAREVVHAGRHLLWSVEVVEPEVRVVEVHHYEARPPRHGKHWKRWRRHHWRHHGHDCDD